MNRVIEEAIPSARPQSVDLTQPAIRDEFYFRYQYEKTKLVAGQLASKSPDAKGPEYQTMHQSQEPDRNIMFGSWLIKNQAKTITSEGMMALNFQAPIEIEILIVPNSVV